MWLDISQRAPIICFLLLAFTVSVEGTGSKEYVWCNSLQLTTDSGDVVTGSLDSLNNVLRTAEKEREVVLMFNFGRAGSGKSLQANYLTGCSNLFVSQKQQQSLTKGVWINSHPTTCYQLAVLHHIEDPLSVCGCNELMCPLLFILDGEGFGHGQVDSSLAGLASIAKIHQFMVPSGNCDSRTASAGRHNFCADDLPKMSMLWQTLSCALDDAVMLPESRPHLIYYYASCPRTHGDENAIINEVQACREDLANLRAAYSNDQPLIADVGIMADAVDIEKTCCKDAEKTCVAGCDTLQAARPAFAEKFRSVYFRDTLAPLLRRGHAPFGGTALNAETLVPQMHSALAHTSAATLSHLGCPQGIVDVLKTMQCSLRVAKDVVIEARTQTMLLALTHLPAQNPDERQREVARSVQQLRDALTVSSVMSPGCQVPSSETAVAYHRDRAAHRLQVDLAAVVKQLDEQWRDQQQLKTELADQKSAFDTMTARINAMESKHESALSALQSTTQSLKTNLAAAQQEINVLKSEVGRIEQKFRVIPDNIQFGQNYVEIGPWRLGTGNGCGTDHISISHNTQRTSHIWRSDGTHHPGPRQWQVDIGGVFWPPAKQEQVDQLNQCSAWA